MFIRLPSILVEKAGQKTGHMFDTIVPAVLELDPAVLE